MARLYFSCLAALCLLAFNAWTGLAHADQTNLFASQVTVVDGWNYESRAIGRPSDTGDPFSCRVSANSSNAPSGRPPGWLNAAQFDTFPLPAGFRITQVLVDIYGSWTNSIQGTFDVEVRGVPSTLPRTFTTSGTCRWLLGWDITSAHPGGWNASNVNDLSVRIKRRSGSSPTEQLWVESFRIRVETAPIPTGACCLPGYACVIRSGPACTADGGQYFADGSGCPQPSCTPPTPTGACCLATPGAASCTITMASSCTGVGQRYFGDNTTCTPPGCVPLPVVQGACCLPDHSCVIETQTVCAARAATYRGDNVACTPQLCPSPEPTGACCLPGGACAQRTAQACQISSGDFRGVNTACSPQACTGACCIDGTTCLVTTEDACDAADGGFYAVGTPCTPLLCDPIGACCLPNGGCEVRRESMCSGDEDEFQGEGAACSPSLCDPVGACCPASGGACVLRAESACSGEDDEFHGDSSTCTPGLCNMMGACCLPCGGSGARCELRTDTQCESANGGFAGNGSVCAPSPCRSNDCCVNAQPIAGLGEFPLDNENASAGPDGQDHARCDYLDFREVPHDVWYRWTSPSGGMAQVSTVGLTDGTDTKIAAYQGASCGGTPLACHDDISDDVYESRVRFRVTAGARYLIQIGTFGDFAAPEDRFEIRIDQTVTLCAADIDGDGLVGLGDLFAYLTEYFSGSAGADFDEDGVISVGDILAFVTAFLEGCT